jgi:hypothetical protein
MDKCFACSNEAEYILPCYHKICDVCVNDIISSDELVCLCYLAEGQCLGDADDSCDKQCLTRFKQEDVLPIDNTSYVVIEKCSLHNEPYTKICYCDRLYCDKCEYSCNPSNDPHTLALFHCKYDIEDWKNQVLLQIGKNKSILVNKINGLKCVMEIIIDNKSIIKQIDDIIDTILVDISHIDNFNQLVNTLPISHIIKRKNGMSQLKINIKDSGIFRIMRSFGLTGATGATGPTGPAGHAIIRGAPTIHKTNIAPQVITNIYEIKIDITSIEDPVLNGVIGCILENDADIYAKCNYAIQLAAQNNYFNIIKCIAKYY